MNNRLIKIKEDLTRLSIKYPNITHIWELYIEKKLNLFEKALCDAEEVILKLQNEVDKDIPQNLILLMYLLNNYNTT